MHIYIYIQVYNQLNLYNPESERYSSMSCIHKDVERIKIKYYICSTYCLKDITLLCTVLMEIRHVIELQKTKHSCNFYGKLNRNGSYAYIHIIHNNNIIGIFEVIKKKKKTWTTISSRHIALYYYTDAIIIISVYIYCGHVNFI